MADLISMLAGASGVGAEEADPNFNQTVLLLHGDGTNGAQNNTFLDSSTNNFTITRNGNTTQGTFSPFSVGAGEWSNYFDGTGDYLSADGSTALQFGTGDFTIEFWVYSLDVSVSERGMFQTSDTAGGLKTTYTTGVAAYFKASGEMSANVGGTTYTTSSASISQSAWHHIAVTRASGVVNVWVNGTSRASGSGNTANLTGQYISVGGYYSTSYLMLGYSSNFRIVKGTAVYTSAFTPSTTPLTAISNTSLLTCQSNRFVDNSTNAFAITRNGDVRVTPFSPFAPSAAYSASTNGGSGYFDGTGDYLQLADNAAWDLTGDYTIEMWLYKATGTSQTFFQLGTSSNILLYQNASNQIIFYSGATIITASTAASLNTWNHIALVRSGGGTNNTVLYLNGVNVGQATNTTSFTGDASNGVRIGAEYPTGFEFNGYVSNVRIVKGTAVYTSAFTPPTAPLTAITNTSLLCNFTNAGIFDNTGKNNLETVGNAQIDTTTKKYGTGSLEFDGTGDYLKIPSSPDVAMGTGNWTLEFWLYLNSTGTQVVLDNRNSPASTSKIYIAYVSNSLNFYTNNANPAITGGSLSSSTWYHIAIARSSGSTKMFVNGTQVGSTYSDTQDYTASNIVIGADSYTLGADPFNGFIDDLRITKGVARYTSNFTPPTAAFPNE